jgi:hypothetical protein
MRKYVSMLFMSMFVICINHSFAQKDSTLSQKIANEFCIEFSKKDITQFKGFEMELGLLIIPIIEKYSRDIEKEWGLSRDNEQDYEKISEKIGQEAALGCPKFLEFIKNNLNELSESSDEEETKSITGVFQRIEEQLFSSIVIKTKSGKEEKLWWFQFFEGSEDLSKKPATLVKKSITVKYIDMEVYDAKLKEYRTVKVIKGLTIN